MNILSFLIGFIIATFLTLIAFISTYSIVSAIYWFIVDKKWRNWHD